MIIISELLMKGKKTDSAFVAKFISECAQEGRDTPDKIVTFAKQMIADIDEEIRAIEAKKIMRSKLLDVVVIFEKPVKDKTEDAKMLSFFKLENQTTCKFICDMVKLKPLSTSDQKLDPDARFAIKQLLECKILNRDTITDHIVMGQRFDEYMKFVLREDK